MPDQETLNRWRFQVQELYDSIIGCQKQFFAWFEEAKAIAPQTDEMSQLIKDVFIDELHYRRWINDLPRVEELTPEELENKRAEVQRLYNIGEEIVRLGTALEMKVTKLRYLFDGNQIQ